VGCQQETKKDPHQVGAGAAWVVEVGPEAAQNEAGVDVDLETLKVAHKGPGPR